jgi:hypothetical protein
MVYRIVFKEESIGLSDKEYYIESDLSRHSVEEYAADFKKFVLEYKITPAAAVAKAFPGKTRLIEGETIILR